MRKTILFLLMIDLLSCVSAVAQSPNNKSDSIKVIALPDVEIISNSSRLMVSSGTEDSNTLHIISPGGGYAIRFLAPKSNYHELRWVRVHLKYSSKTKEGQLRIRLASVADDGSPADDSLLAPILLNTLDLQRAQRHLTLQWPTRHLYVPVRGFFIIVEGVGKVPDEYVSGVQITEGNKKPPPYKISSRTQPGAVIRVVNADNFPKLKGTKPNTNSAESWYRDTVTRQWRGSIPGRSVLLVEALFE